MVLGESEMKFFYKIKAIYYRFFLSAEASLRKKGVKIGKQCCIYSRDFGSEPYLISIGNHVQITAGVKFFTHGAAWILRNEIPNFDFFGKIVIKDNVYIGNNSLIMPGVTIENDVIVGAGSVVTKSIPAGWIVAGNPAKKVGDVEDFKRRMKKYNFKTKGLSFEDKKNIIESKTEDLFIQKEYLK